MTQKSRVLLVDEHPLVREWLANLINHQSDLEVCGEAAKRVLEGIRGVLAGKLYLSDRMSMLMARKFNVGHTKPSGSLIEKLSDREMEVFQL
jgi:DNA-binding NarL/FixJ family response regulator